MCLTMFRFGFRNGNAYSAGYTKGNFAFVGVTEERFPDVTSQDRGVRHMPPPGGI